MKRKLIASLLVLGAVVNIIPTEGVMAATTVSTNTNSVVARNVNSKLNHRIINTPIGNVDCYSYTRGSEKIPLLGNSGYDLVSIGGYSNHSKSGSSSSTNYYALVANEGDPITLSLAADGKDGMSMTVADTECFRARRNDKADNGNKGASITFKMPKTTLDYKIQTVYDDKGVSSHDKYNTYFLACKGSSNFSEQGASIALESLLNTTVTNSTTIDDLKKEMQKNLNSSEFTISATQINQVKATESASGKLEGNATVVDSSGNSKTFKFNLPISATGQSSNTLMESYKNSIKNFKGTNTKNQNNILDLVKKTNDDISVSISNFKKTDATDKVDGKITGTLNITGVAPYNFNIEIPRLAQSTDTAKAILESVVENMNVTNSTDKASIQKLVNNSIDTSVVTAKVDLTDVKKATEANKGIIEGNILIEDKTGVKATIQINKEIEVETQSLSTVKDLYKAYLDTMEKTNSTTEQSIIDAIHITNENIKVKISDFKVNEATETSKGSIQGLIEIQDNEIGEKDTVPVNLIIDYLHQSAKTVVGLYVEAAKNYIATNDTNEQDIINMISITNKDIKVTSDSFKLIPSTDESKGKLSLNLNISDGEKNIVQPLQITINNQPQELATALAETQKLLAQYKITTNDIDIDDLLIKINDNITNPSIFASYSNNDGERIEKVKATQDKNGYVKGSLLLADSKGHKVMIPVNFEILKLSQSLDNAENKVNEYLNNLKANNELKESDVLFDIQNLLDSSITAEITDYKVDAATELSKGMITGKVLLNKDGESREVAINIEIGLQAQSMENASNLITDKLKDMYLTNTSTAKDLEIELSKCITGAEGNKIKIKVADDDFRMMKATQDSDGSVRGKVTLFDSNMNIQYVPYTIKIKQLAQTLDHAASKVNEKLNSLKADNKLTKEVFTEDMKSVITNSEGSKIIIVTDKFELTEATEKIPGKLIVEVTVLDGSSSKTLGKTYEIAKTNQSVEDAQDTIDEIVLPNIKVDNNTSVEDIKNQIKDSVGDNIDVDIKDFKKDESSNKEDGKITGTVIITDKNTGEKIEIPIDITIPKIEEILDEAQDTIDKVLPNIKVDNNTTAEDIKNQIKDNVGGNINVDIKDFKKDDATEKENGKITGTVIITDNNTGEKIEMPIDITIPKIEETLDEAQDTIDKVLPNIKVDNNTTVEDIKNQIKDNVGSNIDVDIKDFKKDDATEKEDGKITGTVIITDKNTGEKTEISIDITIPKLDKPSGGGSSSGGSSNSHHHKNNDEIKNNDELDDFGTIKNPITNSNESNHKGWTSMNGRWHFFDEKGKVKTGWFYIDFKWYYFDSFGVMQTGWQCIDNEWYYLNPIAGQELGAMQTRWINDNGNWYFCNDSGKMLNGWVNDNGNWYYLNPKSDGTKGTMKTGWINDNGNWYFCNDNGKMAHDTFVNGYELASNGAWIK
ncbi:N-acetylmuramoyl-L-alanine amidase family protein [Clostridium botulinum]|uniref:Putative PspC-like surface protein n=1 Tax=Clostridium botulinum TaxID=1491 RepID=A0A0A0UUC1_CLOBO|nr:N-acetylmuramoyl-L-alanine amidase family protein [Clostridium botulinum]AIW54654.1 putative PspC-like surface protein [Clostridium botulinum]AIW54903.1 putative PspC-like surface protein [Clostridium botulinum]AIW54958.1 putative PspC-like surface protein [Clostridium botulinum]MBY6822031.1 N-acetylmuramoyl-L-alanine amidase family protein [Clostridium botulinum]NFJ52470.1 N-acetylmuramoyl-L-alanine amidase family protein [Clostridium botulinum]